MKSDQDISLMVTVPVCAFRKGYAREYLETERIPPPSTIYGFLLSLIGEEDRDAYIGTRIAYALVRQPQLSTVLRTAWRVKSKKLQAGIDKNRRPDYQEILTELEIGIWVQKGELADMVRLFSEYPNKISRFGGLSLGESRDLINDLYWNPKWPPYNAHWLVADNQGDLPLPIWVDHVGSKGTIWGQFRIREMAFDKALAGDDERWITIRNVTDKA